MGTFAGVLLALASSPVDCQSSGGPSSKPAELQCFFGPLAETLGGGPWLVYACDDGKSLVVITDQHNPASPFYFLMSPGSDAHRITGEGTGNKAASDAAGSELSNMSDTQIAGLWARAKAVGRSAPR